MSTLTGWPFWAPSDMKAVERALDLAGASSGDHVIDLGCGDGQVLVAAAQRGCRVTGVECDEELVEQSRAALRENKLDGTVVLGDVFEFDLSDADVIFTYLAPATLQRLVPRIQAADGSRLVTVDFEVPNLEPDDVDANAHLYRLPARQRRRRKPGWPSDGLLVAVTPDRHSLTCLLVHHPGGPVEVALSPELPEFVTLAVGAETAQHGDEVAVDLRWEELEVGDFVAGSIHVKGLPDIPVYALVTEDEEGLWEVTAEGVERLARHRAAGWEPESFEDLLEACDKD